ncbi:MAG: hypothetical protein ABI612_12925 [Betaproteobacteria bacterium]
MPLSNYAFDKFVAQELSELTAPTAISVLHEFPSIDGWLQTFILKNMLERNLPHKHAALAFALLRRAQAAIEDYDDACAALKLVVQRQTTISQYFRLLRKVEATIASLYQAFDIARKPLQSDIFEPNDGTPYQRLNCIYNRSRHVNTLSLPAGHLHPVWLQNDGLYTDGAFLRFDELEQQLRDLGRIAERVSNHDAFPPTDS